MVLLLVLVIRWRPLRVKSKLQVIWRSKVPQLQPWEMVAGLEKGTMDDVDGFRLMKYGFYWIGVRLWGVRSVRFYVFSLWIMALWLTATLQVNASYLWTPINSDRSAPAGTKIQWERDVMDTHFKIRIGWAKGLDFGWDDGKPRFHLLVIWGWTLASP